MRAIFFLLSSFYMLAACEQSLEEAREALGVDPQQPEVIHIGNGMQPEVWFALKKRQGVVVDFKEESDLQSSLIVNEKLLPLVIDRESGEEVPTELGWVARGENAEDILELKIKTNSKCQTFESLQNGLLVCRDDLDRLQFKENTRPVFSSRGHIVYLDKSSTLIILHQGQRKQLSEAADDFFMSRRDELVFRSPYSYEWQILPLSVEFSEVGAQPLVKDTRHVFLSREGDILAFLQKPTDWGKALGLYRLHWESGLAVEPLAQLSSEWQVDGSAKASESLGNRETFYSVIQVQRHHEDQIEKNWIRLHSSGFEWLEVGGKFLAEDEEFMQERDLVAGLEVQSHREWRLAKKENATTGRLELELCSNDEGSNAGVSNLNVLSCVSVPLENDWLIRDAILAERSRIYVAANRASEDQKIESPSFLIQLDFTRTEEGELQWTKIAFETETPIQRFRAIGDLELVPHSDVGLQGTEEKL